MIGSTSPPERLVATPMLVTSALLPHPHPRAAPTSIPRLAPASLAAGEAGGGEAAVVCRGRKRRRPSSPAAVNASFRATFGNAAAPRALNTRTASSIQRRWRQRWRRQRQRQPSPAVVAPPPRPRTSPPPSALKSSLPTATGGPWRPNLSHKTCSLATTSCAYICLSLFLNHDDEHVMFVLLMKKVANSYTHGWHQ